MAGFAPYLQEHITLDALTQLGLNVSLKVGSEQQKVVVSSTDLPELYTENGTVENTIPQATFEALPIAMNSGPKSPTAFLNLVPGVSQPAGNQANGGDDFGLDFNGGTGVSAQIYINGLPLVSSELQGGWEISVRLPPKTSINFKSSPVVFRPFTTARESPTWCTSRQRTTSTALFSKISATPRLMPRASSLLDRRRLSIKMNTAPLWAVPFGGIASFSSAATMDSKL